MSITRSELQNTYTMAHNTISSTAGTSALQAHLAGLQAVADRASHDGYALAQHPVPAPDVRDETLDWNDVLITALADYDDWEKAEQGFGPLDTGWTNPGSDHIAWWITQYGAPAVRAAIANAATDGGEG